MSVQKEEAGRAGGEKQNREMSAEDDFPVFALMTAQFLLGGV